MFRNFVAKPSRKEGRPLNHPRCGELMLCFVGHPRRNQRAVSGFRKAPEQRDPIKVLLRFA